MQAKTDFTRRLIHELKTPLTSLIATSQLLHEEIKDKKLEKLAGYVWDNACSMNNRIDELHDMIKGEIGRLEIELKPLNLQKLLKSILDESQSLAAQHKMILEFQAENPLVPVYADSARVRQVLMNLLNNVFKYAGSGNIVYIKTLTNADNVLVEVHDHGPGITNEEQKRIFEPYYRSSRKRDQSPGLGIGLALCKVLIEAHGGRIWVKSQYGKGSSFFFTLPRLTPENKNYRGEVTSNESSHN
jgi:signal transduction histidine kinase